MIAKTIERLLRDSKSLDEHPIVKAIKTRHPSLTQFIECQLVLKGGYAVAGVLTALPQESLLMAAIAKTPDGKVVLAEHYFGDSEIQAIVVGHDMPQQQLVQPARNGNSPIILGH